MAMIVVKAAAVQIVKNTGGAIGAISSGCFTAIVARLSPWS